MKGPKNRADDVQPVQCPSGAVSPLSPVQTLRACRRSSWRVVVLSAALAALISISSCSSTTSARDSVKHLTTLRYPDNGRTLHLHVGNVIRVALSGYWRLNRPSGALQERGRQIIDRSRCHNAPPGTSCVQIVRTYIAKRSGTANLTASRSTCGEAFPCRPNQTRWQIHLQVSKH